MGRSPTTTDDESSGLVKTENMGVEEEAYDGKLEDEPLSVFTKVPQTANSVSNTPKMKRTRMLFSHLPSVKEEALRTFTEMQGSIYQDEELGESSQQVDVMSCECKPAISDDGVNTACGDNDCINFATSMECTDDDECHCGIDCRNRRFQHREYVDIDVIQTEKKGFGIRTNTNIPVHTFIYEYVGEVIEENTFRSRMHDYDEQGIKHFYFMMIQQGEYIDATKKGGLGRFINHSCAPNCYVDKWVVGTKLRMGIFSDRNIQAGEELTFDYNVDRYGADAQPCYCDEPNCIGYIGGKTQSEAQPKLSHAVKEALGFDDEMDWSTAISRKRRRVKKDDDEDDDYVVAPQTRPVSEDGVAKIMSALLQAREQWVITKLLTRLQVSDDIAIWHRVLKMHGYHILGAVLKEWNTDNVIVTTVLNILLKLPRFTKNKIDDSRIEGTVKDLIENHHPRVKELATTLLEEWSLLEVAFRISRRPKNSTTKSASPSKDGTNSESSKTPIAPTNTTTTPTAPKAIQNTLHRPTKLWHTTPRITNDNPDPFRGVPRGPAAAVTPTPPTVTLPAGWKSAFDAETGNTYYYRRSDGKTQWEVPVDELQQGVTLQKSEFQKIIDEAGRHLAEKLAAEKAEEERRRMELEKEEQEAAEAKARERAERKLKRDERHRRRLSESGPQKPKARLERELEIQFSSYVPNTIVRYYRTLAKDEVKRYAKDITHELVKKEIKAGKTTVDGPLSDHKKQKIKDFVKMYMGKVMDRKAQKEAAKQQQQQPAPSDSVSTTTPQLPESTPRTTTKGDTPVVNDPPSSADGGMENENGEVEGFSPTEFLKTLEMDGLLQG